MPTMISIEKVAESTVAPTATYSESLPPADDEECVINLSLLSNGFVPWFIREA